MELRGDMIPLELVGGMIPLEPTSDTMAVETRQDLEKELQDPEFASYYGADQAKIQLAFTLVDTRNQLNLTQKEVADKLKVSQPYIAELERGSANPTIGKIGGMLALLGLRLHTRTELLLPQPVAPHIVYQVNMGWDLVIGAAATVVGAGITCKEEPSIFTEYTKHASPADMTVAGDSYIREADVRKPVLVGGTVE